MIKKLAVIAWITVMTMTGCAWLSGATPEILTRAEFEQAFPGHIAFYTYDDFVRFTNFGSRRESAMFLANVAHETGGLKLVEEDVGRRAVYCDPSEPYGCPAGPEEYFGRGPLQLSWNYNYRAAGETLRLDLLEDPDLVARDPVVSWQAATWFWANRVPNKTDFGETIRAINGAQECDGRQPMLVQSRISEFHRIAGILRENVGNNLSC